MPITVSYKERYRQHALNTKPANTQFVPIHYSHFDASFDAELGTTILLGGLGSYGLQPLSPSIFHQLISLFHTFTLTVHTQSYSYTICPKFSLIFFLYSSIRDHQLNLINFMFFLPMIILC